jgi:hypothetical protein
MYVGLIMVVFGIIVLTVISVVFSSTNNKNENMYVPDRIITYTLHEEDIITGERLLMCAPKLSGKFETVIEILNQKSQDEVIITHNSDNCVDQNLVDRYPNVKHWFGVNVVNDDHRLHTLPIGLANSQYAHGHIPTLVKHMDQPKTKLCYLNLDTNTNSKVRTPIVKYFQDQKWLTLAHRKSYDQYLKELSSHKFAIVPPGNGPDTHRAWECLYLGVIPIVIKSTHSSLMYDNLPCLQVDKWEEITQDMLQKNYVPYNPHMLPKLRLSYWCRLFRDI